jgi:hypothetical protein
MNDQQLPDRGDVGLQEKIRLLGTLQPSRTKGDFDGSETVSVINGRIELSSSKSCYHF